LSFNLVTLDFAKDERLLKTTMIAFLKSFFVLVDLPIATTREGVSRRLGGSSTTR